MKYHYHVKVKLAVFEFQTLNTEYFIDELKKASFKDQLLMEDEKGNLCNTLSGVLGELSFTNLETIFKKGTTLFNASQAEVEAWQLNINNWNKKLSKELKSEDDYVSLFAFTDLNSFFTIRTTIQFQYQTTKPIFVFLATTVSCFSL